MFLRLQRSQRRSWLGARIYVLTAHIEAEPEDVRIINSHAFSGKHAYIVPLDHVAELEARAEAAYQRQKKLSVWKQDDQLPIMWENAKVVALAIRANLAVHSAFRITVDQLLAGTVAEGRDLAELLEVETAIIRSFDALKCLVDHARAFEHRREMVLAPDDDENDTLAPPSIWPRFSRR
ncbi:MAG TPA: hypothetical protein VJ045_06085 [Hyphomicrobiaceae bacterium]|nr:hypothetical protein [Hyphomicrobiaceae bacterium]